MILMNPAIKGAIATGAYLGAIVFDEHSLVPVGTIIVIGGGIWWLGRKLQQLEDGQKNINDRLDTLPCGPKCGLKITDTK